MNRRALLAVLAAAGACVAFGVGGAAFADAIPADAPADGSAGGPSSPGGGGGGGERLAERSAASGTASCVLCGVSARSLVAGLVPTVDPLAWAVVAATVAAGALVAGLRSGAGTPTDASGATDGDGGARTGKPACACHSDPPDAPAANGVYRAWASMSERVAGTDAASQTPRSVARTAVDAGFDPEAVTRLTDLFERVRYGSAAPTDDRERAAREALADAEDGTEP